MSRFEVDGCVALVTGAGSGIGRSVALLLAQEGARHVYVADIDAERAESVAAELEEAGGGATAVALDVTDADAVGEVADRVYAERGHLNLLVNNAGVGHAGEVISTPLEDWRKVVEVNVMGVVNGIHAFLPRLVTQDEPAAICNTASMAGLTPNANMVPYSMTKYAVVGLSEALALEMEPHGIGVTALCPGVIDTDIVRSTPMRGRFSKHHEGLTDLYSQHGTSPDVVARDALAAVKAGRIIQPTPRYQGLPAWYAKRYAPPVARTISRLTMKVAART